MQFRVLFWNFNRNALFPFYFPFLKSPLKWICRVISYTIFLRKETILTVLLHKCKRKKKHLNYWHFPASSILWILYDSHPISQGVPKFTYFFLISRLSEIWSRWLGFGSFGDDVISPIPYAFFFFFKLLRALQRLQFYFSQIHILTFMCIFQ